MDDYILLHQKTYDSLADEYYERLSRVDSNSRIVGRHLADFSYKKLLEEMKKDKYRILELGCGPGAILASLNDKINLELYAIDLSVKMLSYAEIVCPKLKKINKNVLDITNILYEFNTKEYFDLIIMASFIHLFPINDAKHLLTTIKEWLEPNGLIYIDTTDEGKFEDGKIIAKKGYIEEVKRLRTMWTKNKFNQFLCSFNLKIIEQQLHKDNNNRIWMRTILKKSNTGINNEKN